MSQLVKEIVRDLSFVRESGNQAQRIERIVFDSREAGPATLFFAIKGVLTDGHQYIQSVIESGCTAIITSEPIETKKDIFHGIVTNTQHALALCAAAFYDYPSRKLQLIGVTGTNGKTTTTTLLHDVFSNLGYTAGLLSTVVNKIGRNEITATHTTPDPLNLNRLLAEMVKEDCTHCFMEVSSHAVHQHRISGLHFNGGVFTNITHDHLDYHQTFSAYIEAKKGFFDALDKDAFSLVNADDKHALVMVQNTGAVTRTYALKNPADFKARIMENQFNGLVLQLDGSEVFTRLIGDFNAYNLLAVYGVSCLLGLEKLDVLTAISNLHSVEGRFQQYRSSSGITAIIDYAHTPDALENVLSTVKSIRKSDERILTVVGCGGDRDRGKRPKMARIACALSDHVVLTSDNPRSEDPEVIIAEMLQGISEQKDENKIISITDRTQAIKLAITMAQPGDIVLVAGKGHEKYQEIKGVRYDFDDLQKTIELFKKLGK
jgi:UDP-N-acetylmuramoyl-L-alanyl-D-glutamate--2,6-diaminopimelate ligase